MFKLKSLTFTLSLMLCSPAIHATRTAEVSQLVSDIKNSIGNGTFKRIYTQMPIMNPSTNRLYFIVFQPGHQPTYQDAPIYHVCCQDNCPEIALYSTKGDAFKKHPYDHEAAREIIELLKAGFKSFPKYSSIYTLDGEHRPE